jgi:predicted Mrr-cat superfamily restriction endonuclease
VVTPEPASRTLLLGRVSGPYRYLDDPIAPSYTHARDVRWFARFSRDELSYGARNSLGTLLTLSRPGHQGELLRLAENHGHDGPPEPLEQTRRASPEPEPALVPVAIPATASVPKRAALGEFPTFSRRLLQMLD